MFSGGDAGQLGLGEAFRAMEDLASMCGPARAPAHLPRAASLPQSPQGATLAGMGGERAPGLIELFVDGWKAKRPESSIWGQHARSVATPPGACVGPAALACVVTAIHGGSHAQFVEAVRRCSLKVEAMTEEAPLESPQQSFLLSAP